MKKVLITGIAGSGASYLTEYLTKIDDLEIHGISRWHTDSFNKNLENVKDKICLHFCDLTDLSSVIRTIEKCNPDYIFSMAAIANVNMCFEYPQAIFKNNVDSTFNLLEAIRILKIKPIIHHCGTSEIYGQVKIEDIPIKESQKIDPINVYAISKLAQEKLMKSYYLSYGIPVVLTRTFGYINPRRPDIFSSNFAKQLVDIERGKKTKILHGNLNSTRTLIDVRDMAESYWLAITKCKYGEEYNIGGTTPITVKEFLTKLVSHSSSDITCETSDALLRPVDVTMQVPDVTKFVSETGWNPKYTLDNSIEFLLNYYRNN